MAARFGLLTPAQRRRLKRLPPVKYNETEEEAINAEIRRLAQNRMVVFDAAPKAVQDRANQMGEYPLENWWNSLDDHQRENVLETGYCPPPRQNAWDSFLKF